MYHTPDSPAQGGAGTVYEGLKFKLGLTFPPEYPYKAPGVRFDTPCFHPNVDQYGNICLDILKVAHAFLSGLERFFTSSTSIFFT